MPRACKTAGAAQDVGRVGVATEGQDGRVLEEQQLVTDPLVGALADEALLQRMGLAVPDPAKPASRDRGLGRDGGRVGPRAGRRLPPRHHSRTGSAGRFAAAGGRPPQPPIASPSPSAEMATQARQPDGQRDDEPDGERPPADRAQLTEPDGHADGRERDEDARSGDRVEGRGRVGTDHADRPQAGESEEPEHEQRDRADGTPPHGLGRAAGRAVASSGAASSRSPRDDQMAAIRRSSGAIRAFRISLTTVATSSASGPNAAPVAITWLVSWTATPDHRPNVDGLTLKARPIAG